MIKNFVLVSLATASYFIVASAAAVEISGLIDLPNECFLTQLAPPPEGCRYSVSYDSRGCPIYTLVCDDIFLPVEA